MVALRLLEIGGDGVLLGKRLDAKLLLDLAYLFGIQFHLFSPCPGMGFRPSQNNKVPF